MIDIAQQLPKYKENITRLFSRGTSVKKTADIADTKETAILIPTYSPNNTAYNLIQAIIRFNPKVLIVVIDDCTPLNKKTIPTIDRIKQLAEENKQVVFLRTPVNTLKAGALNYGIDYLMKLPKKPNVVFTFDDDVKINEDTISLMVNELYSERNIGAVCSQVRVKNKNKNILTRLQALEYFGFNITKLSDNGLLQGPLVMQGMLSAFRMSALVAINGYRHGHLIEDYDITARLKVSGWNVKIAHNAIAWTIVPENVEDLWKQRVRWTSGGLHVMQEFWKKPVVVYQDLIGHLLFISLLSLIILSFVFVQAHGTTSVLTIALIVSSIINFLIAFTFNTVMLFFYPYRDRKDILIKMGILPELIYSNILSLILIGSYMFFLYNLIHKLLIAEVKFLHRPYNFGLSAFNKIGFSTTWGTRKEEGGQL